MTTPDRITTERLILRRYQLTDAGEIFACYAQDEAVTKYLTWKPHQSIEETQAFIAGRIDAWDKGDDLTWAVTTVDGHLIGAISLRIDGFKADFGYVIGRKFWGNGQSAIAGSKSEQSSPLQPIF
jgi:ribosomal-protein-alanine N-acetyltransferase